MGANFALNDRNILGENFRLFSFADNEKAVPYHFYIFVYHYYIFTIATLDNGDYIWGGVMGNWKVLCTLPHDLTSGPGFATAS